MLHHLLHATLSFVLMALDVTAFFLIVHVFAAVLPSRFFAGLDAMGAPLVREVTRWFDAVVRPKAGTVREGAKVLGSLAILACIRLCIDFLATAIHDAIVWRAIP